jgi:hypothetical protein
LIRQRRENISRDASLAHAQARMIPQSAAHTIERRIPSTRVLGVSRIEGAQKQVPIYFRSVSYAEEGPLVVMKRIVF